jgi:hypothetical protein
MDIRFVFRVLTADVRVVFRVLTLDVRVLFQDSGQSGTEARFLLELGFTFPIVIPAMLHAYLSRSLSVP